MIEEFPHLLLHYNFSRKKNRYFLTSYEIDISKHGSQKTVCEIIRSSDFLCGVLDIDRPTILKQITTTLPSTGSTTTTDNSDNSSSAVSGPTNSNDSLLTMIEERLDFKHRCMFYSTGPTSNLCGK
jgi:hypothetical protein